MRTKPRNFAKTLTTQEAIAITYRAYQVLSGR